MYTSSMTGAQYAAAWTPPDGTLFRLRNAGSVDYNTFLPYADYESYAGADGRWYTTSCSSTHYSGDDYGAFLTNYYATHPPVFVPAGVAPPAPEVAIETLRDIASDELTLPDPEVGWNPMLEGNGATVVNMETWVWLTDATERFSVTASVGTNAATVDATLRDMTLSAPDAETSTCAGAGIPWSQGAVSDCVIVFERSSANQPGAVTPLTITTGWDASWSANGVQQGALDGQIMTSEVDVPVAEVQTVIVSS